jgi:hypothetical protein
MFEWQIYLFAVFVINIIILGIGKACNMQFWSLAFSDIIIMILVIFLGIELNIVPPLVAVIIATLCAFILLAIVKPLFNDGSTS